MKKLHMNGIAVLMAAGAVLLAAAYVNLPDRPADGSGSRGQPPAAAVAPPGASPGDAAAALPAPAGPAPDSPPDPGEAAVPAASDSAAAAPLAPPAASAQTGGGTAPASAEPADSAAMETIKPPGSRGLIYLDPGHQRKGDSKQEPVSPDSNMTKARVTGGTKGISTGKPEYVLNLEVALLLKEELVKRGFEVLMTRGEHDVNLSNIQRAEMANNAHAQLAVRIHADGNESPKAQGFSVLYPDASVQVTKSIQPDSRLAAEFILDALKAGTEASSRGMQPRKDLTGFNWSKVPVVLVELGFMTNPAEDESLSDPGYQIRLAESMAEGIDSYMKQKEE
ncbi:MAG: hypothetical protein K0S39_480 [Paenibacillus sp.]|jgi:N-acetylmuramoyl-L-alanine amidase|nr:hypothetical protein [Paenibacillus sp.]